MALSGFSSALKANLDFFLQDPQVTRNPNFNYKYDPSKKKNYTFLIFDRFNKNPIEAFVNYVMVDIIKKQDNMESVYLKEIQKCKEGKTRNKCAAIGHVAKQSIQNINNLVLDNLDNQLKSECVQEDQSKRFKTMDKIFQYFTKEQLQNMCKGFTIRKQKRSRKLRRQ